MLVLRFFFFFKQKTAYEISVRDWSSDVCSSDLRTVWPKLSDTSSRSCSAISRMRNRKSGEIGRASCRERVNACVDLGGRRIIKKKKKYISKFWRFIHATNRVIMDIVNK